MASSPQRPAFLGALWALLCHQRTIMVVGSVTLLLILAALFLPQMPGQLNDNPTAATRWLLDTGAAYGPAGPLLRGLGLFNMLHSPVLRLLLALIALILLVHLGDQIGTVLAMRRLPALLDQGAVPAGTALPVESPQRLHRDRWAVPTEAAPFSALATLAAERFTAVRQHAMPLPTDDEPSPGDGGPGQEERLLARRGMRGIVLRPLLVLGLLIALVDVWLMVAVGWEVASPELAPGTAFRYTPHELELRYQLTDEPDPDAADDQAGQQPPALQPALHVRLGDQEAVVPLNTSAETRLAGTMVDVRPGSPGLIVRTTSGAAALVQPGESDTAAVMGLLFPSPGSEESLLLPELAAGLRIVRLNPAAGASHAFLVELFDAAQTDPVERTQIDAGATATLPIPGTEESLELLPVTGIYTDVRHAPAPWLLWLAVPLVVVGLAGFWQRPAFLVAQVAPWSAKKSVVIVQGNVQADVDAALQRVAPAPVEAEES